MDVKLAFLNGILGEAVYIDQPEGFIVNGEEHKVYYLKKFLYRLKQAQRAGNTRIDSYLQENGFAKCPYEHAINIERNTHGEMLIACVYVDDLLFIGNSQQMFQQFKHSMFGDD